MGKSSTARGRVAHGLMAAGAVAICCALVLFCYNVWVGWRAGERAHAVLDLLPEPAVTLDISAIDPNAAMPAVDIDGTSYCGTLSLPELGLELPIANACSSDQLAFTPCRYEGSVYADNLVIAGIDFDAHFGSLTGLNGGEEVVISDTLGNTALYYIDGIEALQPTDLDRAVSGSDDADVDDLRLMVCGADQKVRFVVYCSA